MIAAQAEVAHCAVPQFLVQPNLVVLVDQLHLS